MSREKVCVSNIYTFFPFSNCPEMSFLYFFSISACDLSVYEEVEPFTGIRPVIVCGVLANQICGSLAESYPTIFYECKSGKHTIVQLY